SRDKPLLERITGRLEAQQLQPDEKQQHLQQLYPDVMEELQRFSAAFKDAENLRGTIKDAHQELLEKLEIPEAAIALKPIAEKELQEIQEEQQEPLATTSEERI